MKPRYLILITVLLICSSTVKAQLYQSKSQVMQVMSNDDSWTFDKSGRTNDGTDYLSYSVPTKVADGHVTSSSKAFYFLNDVCLLIKCIKSNNQLSDTIKDLNKRFTSQGNNIWYDDKEKVKYEIVLTENMIVFSVEETALTPTK